MRRSDPTLILLPLLSIIKSAPLRNGQKERGAHKQINNYSLSDNCAIEIPLSQVFPFFIQFDQTCTCNCIIRAPIFIRYCTQIKQKKKERNRITDWNCSSFASLRRFSECNHFKIQAAQLPPQEHEYFTLCKWGPGYEFLDGSDYDTVISEMVMWWWLSLLCPHQRLSLTAHVAQINSIRERREVVF